MSCEDDLIAAQMRIQEWEQWGADIQEAFDAAMLWISYAQALSCVRAAEANPNSAIGPGGHRPPMPPPAPPGS